MIYYESYGDGPAIVLAHGVAGNHASWYQQVPLLSESHRVITFDHRGFGLSPDPDGSGRSAFVDDLAELLDALEVDKAALVGQSMGGATVVGFAGRFPERVSALVIADSLFGIDLPDAVQAGFDEALARAGALTQMDRVLGTEFRENEREKLHLYRVLATFNQTNRHNLAGRWDRTFSPDELSKLGIPILFVVGDEDPIVPPALVRELSALIAGSSVVEIAGAGHSPFFERPSEFNKAVLEFLRGGA